MSFGSTLWTPSEGFTEGSRLREYRKWLQEHYKVPDHIPYHELWRWSVDNHLDFWRSIGEFFGVLRGEAFSSVAEGHMPHVAWFRGAKTNYIGAALQAASDHEPAILFQSERHDLTAISWRELKSQVGALQRLLMDAGVETGDRVGAYIPNIPEATYGFMAACGLGAVWSSCSPDFGSSSVIDRFSQIEPKVLIAVDGYSYGGKVFSKLDVIREIVGEISSIKKVLIVPYLDDDPDLDGIRGAQLWDVRQIDNNAEIVIREVPFEHPIWVLYSSGTTGQPKAITHSHGGVLLEHLKYLAFHNDLHRGERFFWFSTTGWMMWNYVHGALLHGGTIVLYDGSPGYPDLDVLWKLAQDARINHFGTSAPFLVACMKEGLKPGETFNLAHVRSISSTGSPLPPEAFEWVYNAVGEHIWLCSMSGGTDVCTAFVGGCPERPVRSGEIQCRALGVALKAFDENGNEVVDQLGEMVITKPMPSMPVYFWGDEDFERYSESYFEKYPGTWRHGDWVKITPNDGVVIYGRSDATLNRQGVRIGTAEIYRALNQVEAIKDDLIVHIDSDGKDFMPLFVVLHENKVLSDDLKNKIRATLRTYCSPRHVPDAIIEVPDIPYTISGKKMEAPIKKILSGKPPDKSLNKDAMRNPESIKFFIELYKSGKLD